MTNQIGAELPRVDGRAKVTGGAKYAADFRQPDQLHAVVVSATIGLGRITGIEAGEVERMPGVVAVVTHRTALRLPYDPHKGSIDPQVGERLHVLQDDRIRFYGQPVAVIVATTLEQAERAAAALRVAYAPEPPVVELTDIRATAIAPDARGRVQAEQHRGDARQALAQAAVRVEAEYDIAREHHNPMEPHATTAAWQGDRLTLWSKSQFVVNERAEIAAIFGIAPENVEVICPFIGGAFGTSLRTWPHVTLAALAARQVGRPVKLVLTRRQMFFTTGHRPRTLQRVVLGASNEGKIQSLMHDGIGETSRYEQFVEALTSATSYMVSCPNVSIRYRLVPLDSSTPTYMRGPGEASGIFALESALDELAHELSIDPIELRRRNEPTMDEGEGKPFSSRSLMQCYEIGAEAFGWAQRIPKPSAMRDGRLLVGMGVASATYPVLHAPASAKARLLPDGRVEVEVAASDMGPGTYTSMTQVAAETLGIPAGRVAIRLGRASFPPTPPHGGSMTMASVGSAVRAACLEAQRQLAAIDVADTSSPLYGMPAEQLEWHGGSLGRRGSGEAMHDIQTILARAGREIIASATAQRDPAVAARFSMHAFGAVFVELTVDPDLGIIRLRRALGAYAAGRIVNPRLARSQCIGGIVGGMGMALMERSALDPHDGRTVNAHMADYLLPVNLDIPKIDVRFVEEHDPYVNVLGVKGLGEISLVGMAPAVANAVFHATGRRIRTLPIRIEDVLGPHS